MKKTSQLRKLMKEPGILVVPGAYDAMCAKIIERAGFKALHIGGASGSATILGMPDLALFTMSEAVTRAKNLANACTIPVIADADNGYGNAINVMRTVREFEQAGVAGIHLEDQVIPKRCGIFGSKGWKRGVMQIVPKEEMLGKIKAAKDAQEDDDFVLIVRTDAIHAGEGLEGAIERAKAYADAGADSIMFISMTYDHQKTLANRWKKEKMQVPLTIVPTHYPWVTHKELEATGFKICIYSNHVRQIALRAVLDLMEEIKSQRCIREQFVKRRLMSFKDFLELVELPKFRELEQKYGLS